MNINKRSSTILLIIVAAVACLAYIFIRSLAAPTSSKGFTATDIQNIHIDVENAKVHMEAIKSRENKTEVEVIAKGKYDSSNINIESKNNVLVIEQVGSHKILDINLINSLDIYVKVETDEAANQLDQIIVTSENGRVAIENLRSRTIAVQSKNGEINMREISSDELSAHSTSGAIRLDGVNTSKLDTTTENGSSHIVFSNKLENLIASSASSSGSINYIFHNNISLDLKWKGKWSSTLTSDEDSPNKIVLESGSGKISVSRE